MCCGAWGLPLDGVCIPSETPLEKTNFFFASVYRLELASRLGMADVFNPLLSPGSVLALDLWRPYACCHSLFEFIYTSVLQCLEGLVSLVFSILVASHNLSTASSSDFPEPWGEGFGGAIPFRTQCSRVSVRCSAVGLYLLHLLQEEASLVMYEHTITSLGVIFFLLCFFSRTIVFISPRSMTYLFSASWPPEKYQAWVLFHEVAFKSN